MLKVVDVNALFSSYVAEYLKKNKGKLSGDAIEEKSGEIYESFEKTSFAELGGKTPADYYSGETELVSLLREYVKKGVEINDYLIDELKKRGDRKSLASLISDEESEEVIETAFRALEDDYGVCIDECVKILFSEKVCSCVIDKAVEALIPYASEVADAILSGMKKSGKEDSYFVEVLAHSKVKKPEISELILKGLKSGKSVPEYADYARIYDDEGMLPALMDILRVTEAYVPYKELKMTIESLGGYPDERDFSYDEDFIAIKKAAEEADKNESEN